MTHLIQAESKPNKAGYDNSVTAPPSLRAYPYRYAKNKMNPVDPVIMSSNYGAVIFDRMHRIYRIVSINTE